MNFLYFLLANSFYLLLILSKGIIWVPVLFFSITIRLLIWPLYQKASLNQKKIEMLQPKMKEIQQKYREDPFQLNAKLQELFQEEKINPYISFVFIFLQIFLLVVFWNFFRLVISDNWTNFLIFSFRNNFQKFIIQKPLNFSFFNIDLRLPDFFLTFCLAIFNFFFAVFQVWFQTRVSFKKSKARTNTQYSSALLSFLILLFYKGIPSILIIYWFGFSLIGIIQEFLNYRFYVNNKNFDSSSMKN